MEHGRLHRVQREVDRDALGAGAEPHGRRRQRRALGRPVLEPDAEGRPGGAGQAERAPAPALLDVEAPRRDVGEREVREVHLVRRPAGEPRGRRRGEAEAEERELEPEPAAAALGVEVPDVVPPLGPGFGVRPVVDGEEERAGHQGRPEALGDRGPRASISASGASTSPLPVGRPRHQAAAPRTAASAAATTRSRALRTLFLAQRCRRRGPRHPEGRPGAGQERRRHRQEERLAEHAPGRARSAGSSRTRAG